MPDHTNVVKPDYTNVVVYLRAQDVRMLRERNIDDPARWVRATVKDAVAAERLALEIVKRGAPAVDPDYAESAE